MIQLREPVSRGKKLKPEQTTKHGQLRADSPTQLRPVLRVIAQSDQMRTFPAKLVGIRDFPNANLAYSSNLGKTAMMCRSHRGPFLDEMYAVPRRC